MTLAITVHLVLSYNPKGRHWNSLYQQAQACEKPSHISKYVIIIYLTYDIFMQAMLRISKEKIPPNQPQEDTGGIGKICKPEIPHIPTDIFGTVRYSLK